MSKAQSPYVWCEACQRRVLAIYHRCKDSLPDRYTETRTSPVVTADGYSKPKPKRNRAAYMKKHRPRGK